MHVSTWIALMNFVFWIVQTNRDWQSRKMKCMKQNKVHQKIKSLTHKRSICICIMYSVFNLHILCMFKFVLGYLYILPEYFPFIRLWTRVYDKIANYIPNTYNVVHRGQNIEMKCSYWRVDIFQYPVSSHICTGFLTSLFRTRSAKMRKLNGKTAIRMNTTKTRRATLIQNPYGNVWWKPLYAKTASRGVQKWRQGTWKKTH